MLSADLPVVPDQGAIMRMRRRKTRSTRRVDEPGMFMWSMRMEVVMCTSVYQMATPT
jgi:hypothetical protein